jgi:hypothetical protein
VIGKRLCVDGKECLCLLPEGKAEDPGRNEKGNHDLEVRAESIMNVKRRNRVKK